MVRTTVLKVYGRVQGVGFRPFVYKTARELGLRGYVLNSSGNVKIILQGDQEKINKFEERLKREAPPLSYISAIEREESFELELFEEFFIKESEKEDGFVFVSPDIAICEECYREMKDPKDRRFNYPFINCTNCGPRYTIIEELPYDRASTTMKRFNMCENCEKEYKDPVSRRFHAQPISCFECGPRLWIKSKDGDQTIGSGVGLELIKKITDLIKQGKILAIKGVGGFHLVCDATNNEAVALLRKRKNRAHKPFALMMKDITMVEKYLYLDSKEKKLLLSKERPILLLKIKNLGDISELVAPNLLYLGVMLPYAPYHHLMFDFLDVPVVMTSANISGEPIISDNKEAETKLNTIVDYYIFHDRDIRHKTDDSVGFVVNGNFQIIRRSRGYAPDPIILPIKVKPSLALGGELKSCFTLAKDNIAIPSPYIGDLTNKATYEFYTDTLKEYLHLFKIEPEIIITDLHPLYVTTELGLDFSKFMEVKQIQHHKAHIYSLILDRGFKGRLIGFSFDGTGYGEDEHIWGGEVFIGSIEEGLQRVYHFEYFPIVGADYAIENPKRILLCYLSYNLPKFIEKVRYKYSEAELSIITKMIETKDILYTSSLGRIFDMVSSLLDIRDSITYEAQAAIELEMVATKSNILDIYPYELKQDTIEIKETLVEIIKDKERGENIPDIARKFHNTIVDLMVNIGKLLRDLYDIDYVGFSGGVFQNRLLLSLSIELFQANGFNILIHKNVPCNDGGISLGQLVGAIK